MKASVPLLIGALAAASLITGLLLGFNRHPERVKSIPDDIIRIGDPIIPPEPPEPPETKKTEDPPPEEDVAVHVIKAPPSLPDVPIIRDTGFVQPIAPPLPPDIERGKNLVTIPPGRPTGPGHELGQVFDPAQLDQIPVARVQQEPVYPYDMLRNSITGEVIVGFIVDANGNVRDAYVISSNHREFEAPAVQAVSKLKFRPGRRNNHPVNTRMAVPIVFNEK
jgi:periplasmic protein TonB